MVLSVNTSKHAPLRTLFHLADDSCVPPPVSAPFRGTHSVYTLGEKPASPPDLRVFSVGALIALAIHFSMFFAPLFSKHPWDLFCEGRSYSCKDISVLQFLKHVWKSGWAESEDIAPYDATYQAIMTREKNGEGVVNKGTYYTSYVTDMVRSRLGISLRTYAETTHFPLRLSETTGRAVVSPQTLLILPGCRCSSCLDRCVRTILARSIHSPISCVLYRRGIVTSCTETTEWCLFFHNGTRYPASTFLCTVKMSEPILSHFPPRETMCVHHQALNHSFSPVVDELVAGTWNVFTIEDATHASIVPRWTGSKLQTSFFKRLGERLRFMDEGWAAGSAA